MQVVYVHWLALKLMPLALATRCVQSRLQEPQCVALLVVSVSQPVFPVAQCA
jgi:hypothetical protein